MRNPGEHFVRVDPRDPRTFDTAVAMLRGGFLKAPGDEVALRVGNATQVAATVRVPHDKGKKPGGEEE